MPNRVRANGTIWWIGSATTLVAVVIMARAVDVGTLRRAMAAAAAAPWEALFAAAAFGGAFVLRSLVWRRLLPSLSLGQAWAAIHLSLGGNHVLPFRLGEPLRVASVVRRAGIRLAPATASTLTLRAADVVSLLALAGVAGLPLLVGRGPWVLGLTVLAGTAGVAWSARLRRGGEMRLPGPLVLGGTTAAWLLEAVVIWQTARWAGIDLTPAGALMVTAAAVAGQALAVAPAGLGTYEAGAVAGFALLGVAPGAALAATLTAHALKTAYSLATGAVALHLPAPGFLGRLRLPEPEVRGSPTPPGGGPVVLFLPAHDEEASVGHVVERVPERVAGRPVRCLVIDDGSTDRTAAEARRAGAEVVSLPANRGLGAAVRAGLREGLERGAAVVAFCDADGEYDPAELGRLVEPILTDQADYVVGSRFAGAIRRMLPHRRLGNLILTRLLALVARRPITDGQSGYRALSAEAASAAEIIHDFNYAQVLTLDLLAKGFRYQEVPISYSFRRTGRSFVRLGRYLRRVVPAVHRELNTA